MVASGNNPIKTHAKQLMTKQPNTAAQHRPHFDVMISAPHFSGASPPETEPKVKNQGGVHIAN
jgi:hypothetical protein